MSNSDDDWPGDPDSVLNFTPVPFARVRGNGWTVWAQRGFIRALGAMGAVGPAAKAVGMSRASAYKLRERPGAESFARAWDVAIRTGRARMLDFMMDRALNGVTTVTIQRGGSVSVTGGADMKLVHAALRDRNFT